MEIVCRHATVADIGRITEIYNTVIVDSHVSFDEEPHTVEERLEWFATKSTTGVHQAWVAEADGLVVGVAYSGPWRAKAAYARSVETTVVLHPEWIGRGIGRPLYGAMLAAVAAAGAHRAYAIVALPNDASIRFHHAMGFRTVGVLDEAGHKMGRWWSTEMLERTLS